MQTALGSFGDCLKRLREQRHLSQSQLAKKALLNHSSVSRIENGERNPGRETVDALMTALDLTPAERSEVLSLARLSDPMLTDPDILGAARQLAGPNGAAVRMVLQGLARLEAA